MAAECPPDDPRGVDARSDRRGAPDVREGAPVELNATK